MRGVEGFMCRLERGERARSQSTKFTFTSSIERKLQKKGGMERPEDFHLPQKRMSSIRNRAAIALLPGRDIPRRRGRGETQNTTRGESDRYLKSHRIKGVGGKRHP